MFYSSENNPNLVYACFLFYHLFEIYFLFILFLFFLSILQLVLIIEDFFCFFCCFFPKLRLLNRCLRIYFFFFIRLVWLFLAGCFVLFSFVNLSIKITVIYFFSKKLFAFFLDLLLINLKNLTLLKTLSHLIFLCSLYCQLVYLKEVCFVLFKNLMNFLYSLLI